jgi:hypothetical protein
MGLNGYIRPTPLSLKMHDTLNERWVQALIADDPSMLGLGDLVLRDKERSQPRAGRLDLLLQDPESQRRYEVEVQLGATDEAHIIRTIEYWDIERKRYPQYDHCAVLVAENITSRFLNVIGLFNGAVPLVAIQMQALQLPEGVTLVFTRVVDELVRGPIDEDEDADAAPTDRAYWEKRGSKKTVQLADELLNVARQFEPTAALKYNKFYIGLSKDGQPFNFVVFRPRRSGINIELKLPRDSAIDQMIEQAGFTALDYARWGAYRLSLSPEDVASKQQVLQHLIGLAHKNRTE